MRLHLSALLAASVISLAYAGSVAAVPITGGDIMSQFNLVVLGDLESYSHVDGRTYVGGNLTGGTADFFQHGNNAAVSDYAALVVGGNVTGNIKHVNSSGNAVIGGNVDSLGMNGGTAQIGGSINGSVGGKHVTGASVAIPDFGTLFTDYSSAMASQAQNSSVSVAYGRATFTGSVTSGLAVFDISSSLFSQINEIQFDLDPGAYALINVDGNPAQIAANFLGDYSSLQSSLLWNFPDAASINFERQFRGSILAPGAAIRNQNNLEGSVVVNSFVQRGEVHQPIFANNFPPVNAPGLDIPEPQTWALFALALCGMGLVRYRRRPSRPGLRAASI